MNLANKVNIVRCINAEAAGTSDVNGSVIDMEGYEGVMFIVAFGTITSGAVTSIKVQQGSQSNLSDAADLEGTSVSVADTAFNKLAIVDVYRPRERYVRVVVDRGTQNAVIDGGIAIQYGPRELPVTQGDTVEGCEVHASPDEGAA